MHKHAPHALSLISSSHDPCPLPSAMSSRQEQAQASLGRNPSGNVTEQWLDDGARESKKTRSSHRIQDSEIPCAPINSCASCMGPGGVQGDFDEFGLVRHDSNALEPLSSETPQMSWAVKKDSEVGDAPKAASNLRAYPVTLADHQSQETLKPTRRPPRLKSTAMAVRMAVGLHNSCARSGISRRKMSTQHAPSQVLVESNDIFDRYDEMVNLRDVSEKGVKVRVALSQARSLKKRGETHESKQKKFLNKVEQAIGIDIDGDGEVGNGGKRNPYAVIKLASMTATSKDQPCMTKVQRRTLNPVWHFDCKFHVQDPSRDTLHVSLFDASVPADELIGSLSIPLAQCSLRSTNISLDQDVIGGKEAQWYSVRDGTGHITGEVELRIDMLQPSSITSSPVAACRAAHPAAEARISADAYLSHEANAIAPDLPAADSDASESMCIQERALREALEAAHKKKCWRASLTRGGSTDVTGITRLSSDPGSSAQTNQWRSESVLCRSGSVDAGMNSYSSSFGITKNIMLTSQSHSEPELPVLSRSSSVDSGIKSRTAQFSTKTTASNNAVPGAFFAKWHSEPEMPRLSPSSSLNYGKGPMLKDDCIPSSKSGLPPRGSTIKWFGSLKNLFAW